jgi:hypothetical protein
MSEKNVQKHADRQRKKPLKQVKADGSDLRHDWNHQCENCGATPVVPETGLCGPCTFGEAETANGNW